MGRPQKVLSAYLTMHIRPRRLLIIKKVKSFFGLIYSYNQFGIYSNISMCQIFLDEFQIIHYSDNVLSITVEIRMLFSKGLNESIVSKYIYIYMYLVYIYLYTYIYVLNVYISICMYLYIYTHIYLYIHTKYIYTHYNACDRLISCNCDSIQEIFVAPCM